MSPFAHRFAWHVPYRVEVARMQEAAACSRARTTSRPSAAPERTSHHHTILRSVVECRAASARLVDIALPGGTLLVYEVTGTGFLRHMVRAIVGTLVEIGAAGSAGDLRALLDRGRRDRPDRWPGLGCASRAWTTERRRRRLRLSVNSL